MSEPNIGAAILGMYAAIKISQDYGIDWRQLGELVEPEFDGIKNAAYYCEVIMGLREYFEEEEWLRIVGVRFGGWLLEREGD